MDKLIKLLLIHNAIAFVLSIFIAGLNLNLNWLGIISPDIGELIDMDWVAHPDNLNPVSLFTSLFLHIGVIHLLINLLMIWYLGELDLKPVKLITVYIVSGVIGNFIAVVVGDIAILGASSAVMGVLGFSIFAGSRFLTKEVLLIIILTILPGLILPGISNGAHIGGLIVGMIFGLVAIIKTKEKSWNQSA